MAGTGTAGVQTGKIMGAAMCWGQVLAAVMFAVSGRCVEASGESASPPSNANIWNNALFAGNGSSTGVVKGLCNIAGSAHLLGQNLAEGGVAIGNGVDLTGDTLQCNNYAGIPSYLAARVPALEKVNVDGTEVETLHAKLRVKKGLVALNGNAQIGMAPDWTGPGKKTVDGTYVTDGWTGNKVTPDGGRGIPADVHSDNGWNKLYDCGDFVPFPVLTDPWRDPITVERVYRPGYGVPYTQEEYFTEVLLGSPTDPIDGIYTGDINLNVNTDISTGAFYWNATTNTKRTGVAALTALPGANDDYLQFNPSAATLKMNGQIRIHGTLSFSGGGANDTINYSGRCAVLAVSGVNIDVSLLSCNNGVTTDYASSFPQNNCLGIMSKTDINVGAGAGASQLRLVGAFYAQGNIVFKKQTDLLGTAVATCFDNTNQVTNFFQVPALAGHLPLGMIGNYPILLYPAPTSVSAAPIGTNDITWTWKDGSPGVTGFKVWSDPGANTPLTLRDTLDAGTFSWRQTGLSPNALHTFQVAAINPYHFDSDRSAPLSVWTLAAVPAAPTVGGATTHSLTVRIATTNGNPANTEYLLRCTTTGQWVQTDGTLGTPQVWKTASDWGTVTVTGLAESKKYYFAATARNGGGKWTAGGPGAACVTLDATPPTGTIVINNGAASTADPNVTLSLTWSDGTGSGVKSMRFSDDGARWTPWEAVAATKARTLPAPNGYKTVRAQFLDRAGNYSSRFSDYILLSVR